MTWILQGLPLALQKTPQCKTEGGAQADSHDTTGAAFGRASRIASYLLMGFALLYAAFAGLRTVADQDLGWHLASGRWIVQHHSIPSTDVLSYTARGKEWIYPVLSQVLLYGLFTLGGYSLLSWISAAGSAGAIAILLRRGSFITGILAVIAVPVIAQRTQPRPEMATELFFAAFVSLLWFYHLSGRGPLWLLPVLMFFWVNSHLGFIAGLAMCAAYIGLEACEIVFLKTRAPAIQRLRHAAPWLGLTALATLLNPWGARIYVAVSRQDEILRIHRRWVGEWLPVRINPSTLSNFFSWRDPDSAFFWLLAAALLAVTVGLYRRRFIPASLVAAAIYAGLHAARFKAPFASITVIVGGSILADAAVEFEKKHRISPALIKYARPAITLVIFSLVGMRVADLVSNRYYLRTPDKFPLFGPGEAAMFPEAAAHFLQANGLPANIFNDYNSGGFIAWTLSPAYPDYFDGRSIPFGAAFLMHMEKLLEESPDSPDWQREADNRGINTVILALDRELGPLAALDGFCESKSWRPVFLDAYGAVFVRVTPETKDVLQGRRIVCRQVPFDAPPAGVSRRSQADRFKYLLQAAIVLLVLQRNAEALDKLQQAELIFSDNPFLHYAKGVALQSGLGTFPVVEAELLKAIALGSEEAPYVLANLYDIQWRYVDEVRILSQAAERASMPHRLYLRLGYAQLALGRPKDALASFDRAEEESPFVDEAAELGEGFRTQLAEGRRRAHQMMKP